MRLLAIQHQKTLRMMESLAVWGSMDCEDMEAECAFPHLCDGHAGNAASLLVQVLVGEFERADPEFSAREMNPKLWVHLPQDILELVMSRLPVRSKHRFRTVSKAWKAALCSSDVLRGPTGSLPDLCSVQILRRPAAAVVGKPTVAAVDQGAVKTVLRLDLSFLPLKFHGWPSYAVDNGFVVVSDMPSSCSLSARCSFCVFNPMMRIWRELPPLSYPDLYFLSSVTVAVTEGDGAMKLSVVCKQVELDNPILAVYSSCSMQWDFCELNGEASCEDLLLVSGHLLYHVGFHEEEGEALLISELSGGQLKLVQAVALPEAVFINAGQDDIFVVKHGTTVYLVVDVVAGECSAGEIWMLCDSAQKQHPSQKWVFLSSIPGELLDGVDLMVDDVKVVGDYICIRSLDGLYAYSILENTWKLFDRHRVRDYMVPNMITVI